MTVWNHVGLCVSDLDRSIRFYQGVFGFTEVKRMAIPDGPASQLLGVPEPVGLTAVYLSLDGTVLELLHLDRPGDPAPNGRSFTDLGLTHLSFTVDDLAAACAAVRAHGGEVLDATNTYDLAVMVRDPDGQLLELLAVSGPAAAP